MQDHEKTQDQLIEELNAMRRKVAEFEAVQTSLNEEALIYREIVNKASEAIFIIQDGRIKFVNQAATELTGYSKEEGLASEAMEIFVHPDDRDMVYQHHIRRLQGDNTAFRYDFRFVCKDGIVKWAEMNSSLIMWEEKPADLCLANDIIERKRIEETLRESEERYRSLVEHLPQHIFIKDRNSVYVSCNGNYALDLGITPEQIVGKDDFAFHPPELAEAYRTDDQDCMSTGMVKDIEEPYQLAGQERWAHTVKAPYHDRQGQVIGVLGLFEDITERKQVEMALRESEQRLGLALEGGALGLWDWNLKTGLGVWGDRTTRMLGYEPNELDPHIRTWKRAVHPDDLEKVSEVLNGHISG